MARQIRCSWMDSVCFAIAFFAPRIDVQADPPVMPTDYESAVPDTLDLARRAELALHGLSQTLDEKMGYELWLRTTFAANPPYMWHENTGLPTNNPKYAESLVMMRQMTGGEKYLDIQRAMMEAMIQRIGEDGLYYAPAAGRPWHEGVGHKVDIITGDDYANVYGNSRLLLALMGWMQWEPEGPWRDHAARLAHGLSRIAVAKDDYAYYPDNGVGEAFSFPRRGWRHTDEPATEGTGAEGSMFMYHCGPIRALTRWHRLTGDQESIDTASRLVRFVTKERFWGSDGIPPDIVSVQRGYFVGHMHGHTAMLYALAEFASTTKDMRLLNFVRDSYDFARHHGVPRLGAWCNNQPDIEVCTMSDMIAIGVILSEAGMGDYYDDVDAAVRNQLIESQIVSDSALRTIAERSPVHQVTAANESSDRVIERHVGTMCPLQIDGYDAPYGIHCCTGNGTQGLYYAWSKIIETEPDADAVQVNLFLNRASPWMDVDSYLPYEGKVVLRNKTAKSVSVRIPYWVNRDTLIAKRGAEDARIQWVGHYAHFDGLNSGEELTLSFAVPEETVVCRHGGREFTCHFKGSTAVEVKGADRPRAYSIYQRQHYLANLAPMVNVHRHIERELIEW